jgi:type II secretory pathway pseudopilin PulG
MNCRKSEGGYLLLETVVAMAVLSIAILGVNAALREALVTRAQARDYTHARFLLEEVMSRYELMDVVQETREAGDFGEEHPRFRYEVVIEAEEIPLPEEVGALPEAYRQQIEQMQQPLGKVTATIYWTRSGQPFQRQATTFVRPSRFWTRPEDEYAVPGR